MIAERDCKNEIAETGCQEEWAGRDCENIAGRDCRNDCGKEIAGKRLQVGDNGKNIAGSRLKLYCEEEAAENIPEKDCCTEVAGKSLQWRDSEE